MWCISTKVLRQAKDAWMGYFLNLAIGDAEEFSKN